MHTILKQQLAAFGGLALLLAGCVEQRAEVGKADAAMLRPELRISSSNASSRAERAFTAYVTGYGFWDNTPPGSAAIAKPVLHRQAGGVGSYDDPITLAVGHVIEGGRQTLDYPAGTRFYFARLRKYAIVEDVCGNGHRPQDGPCHTGHRGHPWLDIYVGGARVSARETTACAERITSLQPVIVNPRRGYPTEHGEIAGSGCRLY
ncbi:MAG: hypothetical protein R3D84_11375 [Paracoccaceae bacterium]